MSWEVEFKIVPETFQEGKLPREFSHEARDARLAILDPHYGG